MKSFYRHATCDTKRHRKDCSISMVPRLGLLKTPAQPLQAKRDDTRFLSLSRHLYASFGIWNVALLLRRIVAPPLLCCCVPDDTAVMMDLLLSSIACTCASIVAQKSSIGISTLSSPNGLKMKKARRKYVRRLLRVKKGTCQW